MQRNQAEGGVETVVCLFVSDGWGCRAVSRVWIHFRFM